MPRIYPASGPRSALFLRFPGGVLATLLGTLLLAVTLLVVGAGIVGRPALAKDTASARRTAIAKPAAPVHKGKSAVTVPKRMPAVAAPAAMPVAAPAHRVGPAHHAAAVRVQLAEPDVERYRRIFDLQAEGDWAAADREITRLGDRRLLGHVQHHRLLHPSYKSTYPELETWLRRHADHPDSRRIYNLAGRKLPQGQKPPPPPEDADGLAGVGIYDPAAVGSGARILPRGRDISGRPDVVAAVSRIEGHLRAGKPAAALAVLEDDAIAPRLDPVEFDAVRARIASAFLHDGQPRWALTLAVASSVRSAEAVPQADWTAGLAAWRLGQIERAAHHFEAAASSPQASSWEAAAGAFWAARAFQRLDRTAEAQDWLDEAARYPRTFYGLIARRTLGLPLVFDWQVPVLTPAHREALARVPAGHRAIALLQIGQIDRAEQELRRIHPRDDHLLQEALITLADQNGFPALALQVGSAVTAPGGMTYDAALYPLPRWKPQGGYAIDRALMYAFMRQESRFESQAVSPAGARGLMQLMPVTAGYLNGETTDDFENAGRRRLFDPELNLTLGQRFVAFLLATPEIGDNLILIAGAYNAGPSGAVRWRRGLGLGSDPVAFIESIPVRESREYIVRLLANYWIYRLRLGQDLRSLDAVAAGRWPIYKPVDARSHRQVADHADD